MTIRGPLITKRITFPFAQGDVKQRVGLPGQDTFFGPPGKAPNYHWPLPVAAVYPNQTRTHTLSLNLLILGKDIQFGIAGQFKAFDWPLPRQAAYPNANHTYTWNLILTLLGQDKQFGASGQFKTYDWPLPKQTGQGKTWTYSLNQNTLSPVVATPFIPNDWKLPQTVTQLRQDVVQNLLGTTLSLVLSPFANDWEIPQSIPKVDRTWLQNLLTTTLTPLNPVPFAQFDWSRPTAIYYANSNRTWVDSLKLLLQGQDVFFGAAGQGPSYTWNTPTPLGKLSDFSILVNLQETTLNGVGPPPPCAVVITYDGLWVADGLTYHQGLSRPTIAIVACHTGGTGNDIIVTSSISDMRPDMLSKETVTIDGKLP